MSRPKRLLFASPGNEATAAQLAAEIGWERGEMEVRQFPDGESYVRFLTEVAGRDMAIVCTLDRPDEKAMALYFAANVARDLGANRIGLVAPYLAYMRQDATFHDGEGITAAHFARLISGVFDWLVTADPHLHRFHQLSAIYTIPTRVVRAAPAIARWIAAHVDKPLIVGPDEESEQWVAAVAERADCPYTVLRKIRHGDRQVEVSLPHLEEWRDRTPVLVDDIASTARTMAAAVGNIIGAGFPAPVCVAVHPIFAHDAYECLVAAGAGRIVSCTTIAHPSNAIDLSEPIAVAIQDVA